MDAAGIPALVEAIRHLHGLDAKHLKTVRVHEAHGSGVVWDGDVEVFDLVGHRTAIRAYAWSEATTGTMRRFFAMLSVGPIDSAVAAVRASIMAGANR